MAEYISTFRDKKQNCSPIVAGDLTLSVDVPVEDAYSVHDLAVVQAESEKTKWTFMVYMAADSDISYCALYDIVSMQQANIDSEIEVYVLADRSTVDNPRNGDYVTPYGTYQWDSIWPDTRVGKITYSPGLTVTVDWESWGELDTGSIATLERFVNWAQEKSPAENYGLIVWDHGRENTTLCFDITTYPDREACFTVSELSDLLKEKGTFPLVILNNCMLGSELVVTQMAGSTDVIVVSEPLSYGMSTYNYNAFFNTITVDMTAQEMAAIMVQNVESPGIAGVVTMLTSVDVTVSRLAEPLEALAEAIAAADNAADKTVLINALLKAPQDGCLYDGKKMQQSDLGFLIRDVMADPGYESTSEGFKKSLAYVKAALDAIVLEYRSVPSGRGSGITVCNTVCSAENFVGSGNSVGKADSMVKSYIISTYKSNPLWGGLLYDLCSTYLAEIPYESEWSDDVTLDDLTGTKDEVSWKPSAVVPQYIVQFSTDSFEHAFAFETAGTVVDLLGVPAGTYRWRVGVKEEEGTSVPEEWYVGEAFISDNTNENARVFPSKADAIDDLFFATPNGTWSSLYYAKHVGSVGDWSGTGEMVSAAGKGRIQDLFFGSVDPAILCLTDSENGDALFLDDVYTVLPDEIEENTARLLRLQYIKAGAGDDIVDMTSQRFEYAGSKLFIYGGDGDDVIWAGKGRNMLFGDAGNDRIVGASGDDVIVGGIGNDAMHGGGGNDIFTFCENWGADTIEQPAEGSVTLWFLEGSMDNWDAASLTYKDGGNSVTVSGVSAENVTLKFGVEQSEVFVRLYYKNAFAEFASQKIFDDKDNGILASAST